ncbi:hypothetical protein CPC08DRAFT_769092 [Agrocybe pediades]|nr:hypothetical protein CPC08DRAFT_769092 [Agrocybe pediades]
MFPAPISPPSASQTGPLTVFLLARIFLLDKSVYAQIREENLALKTLVVPLELSVSRVASVVQMATSLAVRVEIRAAHLKGEEPPPPPTTKQVTRTATKTSTSRIAQTATKTTVSESVSESASISATAVEETATASFSLAPPPTPTDGHIEKAQVSFNYEDILQPRAKSKEQDVAVRKAAVDSLFENMCKGIEEFGDRDSQSIVLTHNPSSGKENRKEACGNVSCAAGQSCDEFPFASSAEGGLGAIANCIIALGNSIQGGFLRSLLSSAGIGDGDHYLLQLTNVNCQDFLPTSGRRDLDRRQQVPPTSGLTSQMQELDVTTFGALGANDAFDHGLYYIGDLTSGQYAVNISLTNGVVSAYYIIDYQGATYAASYFNASMTGAALDFTLPSDTTGVTLMLDSVLDFNVSGSMTKISGGSSGARQQASAQIWFMVLIGALGLVSNTLV